MHTTWYNNEKSKKGRPPPTHSLMKWKKVAEWGLHSLKFSCIFCIKRLMMVIALSFFFSFPAQYLLSLFCTLHTLKYLIYKIYKIKLQKKRKNYFSVAKRVLYTNLERKKNEHRKQKNIIYPIFFVLLLLVLIFLFEKYI